MNVPIPPSSSLHSHLSNAGSFTPQRTNEVTRLIGLLSSLILTFRTEKKTMQLATGSFLSFLSPSTRRRRLVVSHPVAHPQCHNAPNDATMVDAQLHTWTVCVCVCVRQQGMTVGSTTPTQFPRLPCTCVPRYTIRYNLGCDGDVGASCAFGPSACLCARVCTPSSPVCVGENVVEKIDIHRWWKFNFSPRCVNQFDGLALFKLSRCTPVPGERDAQPRNVNN